MAQPEHGSPAIQQEREPTRTLKQAKFTFHAELNDFLPERRKNLALLATYPSLQDLEEAQARALANNAEATKQVQTRIAELQKRQQRLEADAEFHKGKPLPLLLKRDIFDVEADLRAQTELLGVKNREVDAINARYGEDKRRYLEITKSAGASAAAATQTTPAAKR